MDDMDSDAGIDDQPVTPPPMNQFMWGQPQQLVLPNGMGMQRSYAFMPPQNNFAHHSLPSHPLAFHNEVREQPMNLIRPSFFAGNPMPNMAQTANHFPSQQNGPMPNMAPAANHFAYQQNGPMPNIAPNANHFPCQQNGTAYPEPDLPGDISGWAFI